MLLKRRTLLCLFMIAVLFIGSLTFKVAAAENTRSDLVTGVSIGTEYSDSTTTFYENGEMYFIIKFDQTGKPKLKHGDTFTLEVSPQAMFQAQHADIVFKDKSETEHIIGFCDVTPEPGQDTKIKVMFNKAAETIPYTDFKGSIKIRTAPYVPAVSLGNSFSRFSSIRVSVKQNGKAFSEINSSNNYDNSIPWVNATFTYDRGITAPSPIRISQEWSDSEPTTEFCALSFYLNIQYSDYTFDRSSIIIERQNPETGQYENYSQADYDAFFEPDSSSLMQGLDGTFTLNIYGVDNARYRVGITAVPGSELSRTAPSAFGHGIHALHLPTPAVTGILQSVSAAFVAAPATSSVPNSEVPATSEPAQSATPDPTLRPTSSPTLRPTLSPTLSPTSSASPTASPSPNPENTITPSATSEPEPTVSEAPPVITPVPTTPGNETALPGLPDGFTVRGDGDDVFVIFNGEGIPFGTVTVPEGKTLFDMSFSDMVPEKGKPNPQTSDTDNAASVFVLCAASISLIWLRIGKKEKRIES